MSFFLVALGGFTGSITRFYISNKVNKRLIGTWIANITGSFLLAALFILFKTEIIPEWLWVLAGIGYCGAYTTFSTFGNETLQLIFAKKYKIAFSYVGSSLAMSLIVVFSVFYIFM
ncbi:chromosome condensation protein CrcB [Virgibacillus profundi]|uniref:Fluoride-specific ion channel FluC n=1 Tax=Virgibacillus profundi TaxID=2024555 RepID=A0A2A2IBI8_9BACI|nr:CrcB family protein [Virgibacillus profundi]PAV28654.1 chromosome condensation protein CrcB [Virgibacillus profundi]PXY52822.1 CrcB family protein [Virgibacillus profundi]